MKAHINWKSLIGKELNKPYYKNLIEFIKKERNEFKIVPKNENWFNALSLDPEKIKVVILGQDPYCNEKQANGFAFSVPHNIVPPPSLLNIYKEIENQYQYIMSKTNGDLTPWVEQGVLLFNSILTVRAKQPASHANKGWEEFTNTIIKTISDTYNPKVFILWGNYAKSKAYLIDSKKNLILMAAHPSPKSAENGFFGNNHFVLANNFLKSNGLSPINWEISDY